MKENRWHKWKRLIGDESGQGMSEYGLIIGILAVGCVALLGGPVREAVISLYNLIRDKVIPALTGE